MSTSPNGLINPFEQPRRKVEISPTTDPKEFAWKCPLCMNITAELKSEFSDNHLYTCSDPNCTFQHFIQNVPDDIKHWMTSTDQFQDVDQRPRIVGR